LVTSIKKLSDTVPANSYDEFASSSSELLYLPGWALSSQAGVTLNRWLVGLLFAAVLAGSFLVTLM
jgi:hypothetical protein